MKSNAPKWRKKCVILKLGDIKMCKGLSECFLEDIDHKYGLSEVQVFDRSRPVFVLRRVGVKLTTQDHKTGLMLNYCPSCGSNLRGFDKVKKTL